MTELSFWNSMLERVVSLPYLVLVAYGVCLCALLLFSVRLLREGARLRRALSEGKGG